MTCMTVFAASTAMATTQLARVSQPSVIENQAANSWQLEGCGERNPRMSWVVATEQDGRRQLRILWR